MQNLIFLCAKYGKTFYTKICKDLLLKETALRNEIVRQGSVVCELQCEPVYSSLDFDLLLRGREKERERERVDYCYIELVDAQQITEYSPTVIHIA